MTRPPVFLVTGPPAAGKTTLSQALIEQFEFGFHVKVDDLRTWVISGLSDSVPWTDETERQFQIAEAASCDVARRYSDAGFAVAIDHCRNIGRLNGLEHNHLAGLFVVKVCLLPDLATNLERNRLRTNKDFDPLILEDTIRFVSDTYRSTDRSGWLVLDNSTQSLGDSVAAVLAWMRQASIGPA